MRQGALLVISGPSGAGKSSLIREILKHIPNSIFSISTTTREKREDELHGVNYFFTDKKNFQKEIDDGLFLEWASVHGNFYGTSLKQISDSLSNGKLVVLDIDVQGYMIAKEKLGQFITSVFLTTKSQSDLKDRLILRQSDKDEVIKERLENAVDEMAYLEQYEYLVINDDFKTATEEILSIASAARYKRSLVDGQKFISSWTKFYKKS